MQHDPLPVIELAWLTDAELATACTAKGIPLSGLQEALDQQYPDLAYRNLNVEDDKPPLKTVKADAVRTRADQVFGPYTLGWKDEVEILSLAPEGRKEGSGTEQTWYVVDLKYKFYYLVKWTDDMSTEHRAWVGLPDLYDSDRMLDRGFAYRAGRSTGLKQAFNYLGGFRHLTGKFDNPGEDEDNLRPGSARSVPVTPPPAAIASEADSQRNGHSNPELAAAATPAVQGTGALTSPEQVIPATLVKDTDLSWLKDEFTRKTTLRRCGDYAWGELATKVPTAVSLFLVKEAKSTPEAIQAAIKAGTAATSAGSTAHVKASAANK